MYAHEPLLRTGTAAVPGSLVPPSRARTPDRPGLLDGDAALLRFLAAVELIQADVWVQYDELGGIHGGHPAYVAAL